MEVGPFFKENQQVKYILKKAGMMILTLFVVSILVFLAFNLIPGDPATRILGTEATQNQLAMLRQEMGLNDPIYVRYFRWVTGFIQGDLGTSYSYGSVSALIMDKIPITIWLAVMAFLLMFFISIPLGIWEQLMIFN